MNAVRRLSIALVAMVWVAAWSVQGVASTISGQVFNDLNGNGALNPGEPGLANRTVTLDTGADGSIDLTTTTDGSGNYTFIALGAGTYRVRESLPFGWVQTSANPADLVIDATTNVVLVNFGVQLAPLVATAAVPALDPWKLAMLIAMLGVAGLVAFKRLAGPRALRRR